MKPWTPIYESTPLPFYRHFPFIKIQLVLNTSLIPSLKGALRTVHMFCSLATLFSLCVFASKLFLFKMVDSSHYFAVHPSHLLKNVC